MYIQLAFRWKQRTNSGIHTLHSFGCRWNYQAQLPKSSASLGYSMAREATLVCKYTIEGRFLKEQHLKNFDKLSKAYRKIMQEGNALYGSIQPIDGQPNLSVEEVLQYSNKDLFLHMPQSHVGIFDVKALEEELLILKKTESLLPVSSISHQINPLLSAAVKRGSSH